MLEKEVKGKGLTTQNLNIFMDTRNPQITMEDITVQSGLTIYPITEFSKNLQDTISNHLENLRKEGSEIRRRRAERRFKE